MTNQQSNKELVKAGHAFAAALTTDTPIIDMAKLFSELATRLDVMSARCNVIAAENSHLWPKAASELSNAWLLHKTMMGAQAALYCLQKGDVHAAKEWLEGTTDNCELEIPDEAGLNDLDTWFTGHMKGNITHSEALAIIRQELPTTDVILNSVRAEGIHFAANRMLGAWESGFINDTPEQAFDISGAVLTAVEFLPNASHEEFTRDYCDEVRSAIAKSRNADAAKDGE